MEPHWDPHIWKKPYSKISKIFFEKEMNTFIIITFRMHKIDLKKYM